MNGSKDINIHISSASVFKAILIILLVWSIYFFKDLVIIILTSIVIASAIEPGTRKIQQYGVPRLPSVIFIYLLLAVIFVGLFYLFIPPLFSEASNFLVNLPQFVDSIDFWTTSLSQSDGLGIFGPAVEGIDVLSIREAVNDVRGLVNNATEGFWKTVSTVFGGVLSFLLIIILSFYLSVQEKGIDNFLKVIIPPRHQLYVIDLWKRSQRKIGRWMQGQLLLALLIGVLVYLGLAILDMRFAFLLAVLAAFLELIPLFGPIIAAIPAIIIAFMDSGVSLALIIIGFYIIIQQFENHLIFPLVVKKVTGLPAIFVIISILIGGKLAGFLGIVISVPIATAIMEYLGDLKQKNQKAFENEAS